MVEAIELGQRVAVLEVTEDLEAVLEAGGALLRLREEIGGGLGYQPYPLWFQEWALKEAEAATLRFFEPLVVPGMFQTADYAAAIFGTRLKITDEEIEEQVAARLKRQDVLVREEPPMVWVIIDEGVLRRRVGGRHVMCEQVNRLVEAARRPNIVIEAVPAGVGAYLGLLGSFAMADFTDIPSVGYQDAPAGGQMVEAPHSVGVLDLTWNTLRAETLSRAASLTLLEEAAKSWTSAT
jgi:hypothetical protein